MQIMVKGDPALVYSWSPAAGLSNPDIMDPFAGPAQKTIYVLTAYLSGDSSCSVSDSITINVITAQLTNVTIDQTIPYGSSMQLNADSALYYTWTPDNGTLNNPNINNPVATPKTTTTYVVYRHG